MAEHDNWDAHWENYAAAASENPAQQMRHRIVAQLLRDDTAGRPARVLDIGSGQGDLLVRLRRELPGAELAGFELSSSGVEVSRRKVPEARIHVVDLFRPGPDAEPFRGWATHAVCLEVLEHVDSPADFLRAARAYLADGARVVVSVPGGPMSAFDRHIGHRQHFTRESVARVLQDAGYRVDRTYRAGFPFFNLYRGIVIARGERLATDVQGPGGATGGLAGAVMKVFRGLFALNLRDSPLGWQILAVATKDGRGA